MTETTFLKAMKYLMQYYMSFSPTKEQINLWYQELKGLTDEEFIQVVNSYKLNNTFAPQSPTALINEFKRVLTTSKDPNQAFEKFRDYMRTKSTSNKRLEEVFEGFELRLAIQYYREMDGVYSAQVPFIRNRYVADYKENVEKAVEQELALKLISGLLLE